MNETDELINGNLRSDHLILKGLAGLLTKDEQVEAAVMLRFHRDKAMGMEKMFHKWTKLFEEAGIK